MELIEKLIVFFLHYLSGIRTQRISVIRAIRVFLFQLQQTYLFIGMNSEVYFPDF